MEITAEMVRLLREKTGAGMMKCKEALQICKGNAEDAVDYLRKKGLASADNKAGRTTSQGQVTAILSGDRRSAAIVEINCETDFVARNENFRNFSQTIGEFLLSKPAIKSPEDLNNATLPSGQKVEEARKGLITKTGENVTFSRCERMDIPKDKHGLIDVYIHNEGTLGVLVQVESGDPGASKHEDLKAFIHEVALQVAAMKPWFVSRGDVPANVLAREKDVVLGQIKNDPKNASKPENILAKIVEGRLDKFYKERCLIEQVFIRDDQKTIGDLMNDTAKKLGCEVKVIAFKRWNIGEGGASAAPAESERSAEE